MQQVSIVVKDKVVPTLPMYLYPGTTYRYLDIR